MLKDTLNIERVDDEELGRTYRCNGKSMASVNKVLDYVEDKSFLFEWKKRIGEEEANKITYNSATDGTKVHLANECFFSKEDFTLDTTRQKQIHGQFTKFLNIVTEPLGHEVKVIWSANLDENGNKHPDGKECGVGGTFDACLNVDTSKLINIETGECPFDVDNSIFLIDYKTQRKKKRCSIHASSLSTNICLYRSNKSDDIRKLWNQQSFNCRRYI